MRTKSILLLLMCAFTVGIFAQNSKHNAKSIKQDTASIFIDRYVDSLKFSRQQLDSLQLVKSSSTAETDLKADYFRLFAPLTFYNNIAQNNFSLSEEAAFPEVDRSLLSVYLQRPDLVVGTQRQLEEAGDIIKPKSETVAPDVDIVEKLESNVAESDFAPVDLMVKKPNFWKFSANFFLNLNQNYVSTNWYQGGQSAYTAVTGITLNANYNNLKKFVWENTLELKVGVTKSRNDSLHHVLVNSGNLIRYTGKIGIQASKKWKYTIQTIVTTQMLRQFKSNDKTVYSDILSPLTVNPSIGMDYDVKWFKGKLTGSVNMAPLAYNMTYYHRGHVAVLSGLPEGEHFIDDYGSQITSKLTWKIANDIEWYMRMYAYTSYHRVLFECENTFTFRVNKYIKSTLFIYPRFDDSRTRDDHHGYWHFKEYLALGLSYSI